ncbi:MAG: succinate dehydrogenase, cytochrome b556 subunit [Sphingomonadaceae bacterium]|nr:succinate dehydrogenase, cytochrome b556 subunit [Sphingomonadaceae bacterium]
MARAALILGEKAMAAKGDKILSPHLQVYRWGPHMLVSILHRATGDGLAIVGSLLFLCWLGAAAGGEASYAKFIGYIWGTAGEPMHWYNWLGRALLVGLSWAFFQHAASGLRHLLLDTGAGYELKANRFWSLIVASVPALLTAALWLYIFYRGV